MMSGDVLSEADIREYFGTQFERHLSKGLKKPPDDVRIIKPWFSQVDAHCRFEVEVMRSYTNDTVIVQVFQEAFICLSCLLCWHFLVYVFSSKPHLRWS